MLVYEVVDEGPGLLILQLLFADAGPDEELPQLGLQHILQLEPPVRVPPHVADVLEVGRQRNVRFLQLALLTLLPEPFEIKIENTKYC